LIFSHLAFPTFRPDTTISGSRSGLNVAAFHDYISRHGEEMDMLKYWSSYNSARFAAKLIARSIKSTFLSFARDKVNLPKNELEEYLYQEQEAQYDKDATVKSPLVFNFVGSLSIIIPQPSYFIQDKYSLSLDVIKLPKALYKFKPEYVEAQRALLEKQMAGELTPGQDGPILFDNTHDPDCYTLKAAHIFAMESLSTGLIQQLAADLAKDTVVVALSEALAS
jgi:hypothetical protein